MNVMEDPITIRHDIRRYRELLRRELPESTRQRLGSLLAEAQAWLELVLEAADTPDDNEQIESWDELPSKQELAALLDLGAGDRSYGE